MRPRKLPIAALIVLRARSIPIAASKESVAAARAIHAPVLRAPAARQTGDPPASTPGKTLTFAVDAERSAIRTVRTSYVAATAETVNIRAPQLGPMLAGRSRLRHGSQPGGKLRPLRPSLPSPGCRVCRLRRRQLRAGVLSGIPAVSTGHLFLAR